MTAWSNEIKHTGQQLVGVVVAHVMQITVHWLEVPLPPSLSTFAGSGSYIAPSKGNTSWKAHDSTISTIELYPPSCEAGAGTLILFSSSLDGTVKEWELTQPFVVPGFSSPDPPDTYRTLLGGDGKGLPILGYSWSPGQYFMAVMTLQRKNIAHSSFLKSFHILEKGHTRVSVHLAPGGQRRPRPHSPVETSLGRGGGNERRRLLREAVWLYLFPGIGTTCLFFVFFHGVSLVGQSLTFKILHYYILGNEPYLKAIEDDAYDLCASDEKLRLKHSLICSQEGLGPSSTEALKLRWRLLRRWCEGHLKEIRGCPDDQHGGSNRFLMRQLVGKVGGNEEVMGGGDKVVPTQTLKEFCEACKSEVLPFHGSEDNGDPLRATCPGNHVTRRCMRTLRISSDAASVLTCPLCSSICLVTFPTMPCLFCDMTLCE